MTWRDRPARARRDEAGFTLLELVVVFAILGLVLALFVGRVTGPSAGLTLRAAANELAAGLRDARSAAIAVNRPVAVTIDAANRRWVAADGAVWLLPVNAIVAVALPDGTSGAGATVRILFEPDGSASGGRVTLQSDRQRLAVGVDWITGRVTIANAK